MGVGEVGGHGEPPEPDFDQVLTDLKQGVIAAQAWFASHFPEMAPALQGIVSVLSSHTLEVSDTLGEAGFVRDRDRQALIFNLTEIKRMWLAGGEIAAARMPSASHEDVQKIRQIAVALYVLHETFHVVQKFEKHELAKVLKAAFGVDELSKFDLVADVAAANCVTLVSLATGSDFDANEYLRVFGGNILLAYDLLCRGFKTAGVDHKKKRALGLLTSLALVRLALETNEPERRKRLHKLATTPAYTSIDPDTDVIIALTCCANPGGWKILFSATSTKQVIEALWADPGQASAERALGILLSAYRDAEFTPEED